MDRQPRLGTRPAPSCSDCSSLHGRVESAYDPVPAEKSELDRRIVDWLSGAQGVRPVQKGRADSLAEAENNSSEP
jgi:hypothetical protein